jgi:hypothetical protein
VVESVLNFGWFGLPVSFGIMLLVVFGNYALYRRLRRGLDGPRHTLRVMVYAVLTPGTCMLLYMDFSTAGISMITRLSMLGTLYILLVAPVLQARPAASHASQRVGTAV